jgi:hypothetical protein
MNVCIHVCTDISPENNVILCSHAHMQHLVISYTHAVNGPVLGIWGTSHKQPSNTKTRDLGV